MAGDMLGGIIDLEVQFSVIDNLYFLLDAILLIIIIIHFISIREAIFTLLLYL